MYVVGCIDVGKVGCGCVGGWGKIIWCCVVVDGIYFDGFVCGCFVFVGIVVGGGFVCGECDGG